MNIYVGNLSLETTEEELREEFTEFGEVTSVIIMNDKYIGSGQPRGYGYVEMSSKAEGKAAIASMEGLYNIGEMERQLAEAERKLEEDAPFPADIDSNDVIEMFIRIEKEAGLKVFYHEPGDSDTTTINGNIYHTKYYSTYVCGEDEPLSKLIKLLELLENEQYNTLRNDNLELTGPDVWSLNFDIIIVYQ